VNVVVRFRPYFYANSLMVPGQWNRFYENTSALNMPYR
jgi:hypothetical protein